MDKDVSLEEKRQVSGQANRAQKDYLDYCRNKKTGGIKASCHRPREQGPDISLMTEIIYHKSMTGPLFPGAEYLEDDSDSLGSDSDSDSDTDKPGQSKVTSMAFGAVAPQ